MRTLILFILLIGIIGGANAQVGQLSGKVTDEITGEELFGAYVILDGTTIGSVTEFSGDYTVTNIKEGTYTIKCQLLSYETVFVQNVTIKPGATTTLNFKLKTANLDLQEVVVVGKVSKTNENMLLLEQKTNTQFTEAIGAQQLATQGVSDAAGAATKMTGINKQSGGKSLFIRGLGDRYNATTLNGLPLPSNNAELKNIDLELFSTDIIEYVNVTKSFSPQISGDCAGGNINIESKKHTGESYLKAGLKLGANTNVLGSDNFMLAKDATVGGFGNSSKPSTLTTYEFDNSLDPTETNGTPEWGISLSSGNTAKLGESKLNIFASASYENSYVQSEDIKRKVNGSDLVSKDLEGFRYGIGTQTMGMANLNLDRKNSSYYINTLFSNYSEHETSNLEGLIIDVAEAGAYVRRTEFERTQILVNQLLGKNNFGKRNQLNWAIAYNLVNNIVPDRRDNILDGTDPVLKYVSFNDKGNNKRYFHEMTEDEIAANLSFDHQFGKPLEDKSYRGTITIGYSTRFKNHEFESSQYNTTIHPAGQTQLVDVMKMDGFFNNTNQQNGYFSLAKLPSSYNGELMIQAGFGMLEYALNKKTDVIVGLRMEYIYQQIDYATVLGKGKESFEELKPLPSIILKYSATEKTNLRFAASSTYTLPQFKETAPFLFEGITDATVGNPYLYPSTNYNGEIKFEFFPNVSEIFSVAFFGKYIQDPINKFVMASATNEFTYANTGDWANVGGTELEFRKDLFTSKIEGGEQKVFLNANATFMKTNQELNKEKIQEESNNTISVNFNTAEEELEGAASVISNISLGHKINWEEKTLTNTLVYNYVSDNITLIGYQTLGNQVAVPLHSLDYVLNWSINRFGLKFSAKNILNRNFEKIQENSTKSFLVSSENKGTKISIDLTYKF